MASLRSCSTVRLWPKSAAARRLDEAARESRRGSLRRRSHRLRGRVGEGFPWAWLRSDHLRLREVITGGGLPGSGAPPAMATLTVPALRRAIETRDGETLAGFCADDAVLRIVDQENPPSKPTEIKGHDAIAAHYADVGGRSMTHRVGYRRCRR
jgi:hypothetical protein